MSAAILFRPQTYSANSSPLRCLRYTRTLQEQRANFSTTRRIEVLYVDDSAGDMLTFAECVPYCFDDRLLRRLGDLFVGVLVGFGNVRTIPRWGERFPKRRSLSEYRELFH
jgi:hypothetical protein